MMDISDSADPTPATTPANAQRVLVLQGGGALGSYQAGAYQALCHHDFEPEWIAGISAKNKFVSGTGLPFADAKVVRHNKMVTNGPFGEIKETIGGFIMVKADSVDEAVEFAKGCPVLQGEGNTVEVRKIAKNDGVH